MAKTEKIEVRIPAETMAELQALANSAGLKAKQVMALALAVGMRRWNRESGVRAERDAAIDMLRHLASAKRGAVCNYDNGPIEKPTQPLIAAAPKLLDIAQRLGVYLPAELQPEVNAVIAEALGHDG